MRPALTLDKAKSCSAKRRVCRSGHSECQTAAGTCVRNASPKSILEERELTSEQRRHPLSWQRSFGRQTFKWEPEPRRLTCAALGAPAFVDSSRDFTATPRGASAAISEHHRAISSCRPRKHHAHSQCARRAPVSRDVTRQYPAGRTRIAPPNAR